jgi:hypothetical protein
MSFLDGMFPSSPDDPRYAANMALFGSMMKGDFAGGVQSYGEAMQRAKAQAMQGRLAELQLRKGGLEVTDMERRLADEQATRDVLQGLARDRVQQPPQGQPQGQPPQAPAAPGSFGAMPEPMPNAAPQQAQPPQGAPQGPQGPAPARNNVWQFYQHVADTLRDRGLSAQAQNYYSLAEKFRPKFGTEPRVMTDPSTGKLVQVLVAEDGTTNVLPFGVKPNMKLQDLGGSVQAIDENALPNGQVFGKTMTPGEVASNSVAWANNKATLRGQDLTDARAREQAQQGKVPAGYRPTAADPAALEFIPGGPADPNAAKRAAPTEFQGKAMMFGARAQASDKILNQIGANYSPAGVNAKMGVESVPMLGQGLGAVANVALSDNSQKAEQAQRDFVNAVMRLESGAAINQGEFDNARKQYFPQPGDSPAVIAQKAQNRQMAIRGLLANARPGSVENMLPNTGSTGGEWKIERVN